MLYSVEMSASEKLLSTTWYRGVVGSDEYGRQTIHFYDLMTTTQAENCTLPALLASGKHSQPHKVYWHVQGQKVQFLQIDFRQWS
jgi:hypothetical protein